MRRVVAFLTAALLIAGCAGAVSDPPVLLRTVPSRSIEVMYFRHAERALETLLDSTHVFRRLDLGRLGNDEMVLSYDYSSTMVPLLALDAGHSRGDTSSAVSGIIRQASALDLYSAYVVDTAARRAALLLSPSSASISEARIHISAGASILDAPDFVDALALADGSEGTVILRNSAAARWVPKDFLGGKVQRRKLVRFLSGACEWTVVSFDGGRTSGLKVRTSGSRARYYLPIFRSIKDGSCKVGGILPEGVDLVVDLPLDDWRAFYEARCGWLDANSMLLGHKRAKDTLSVNPMQWFQEHEPQEVARMDNLLAIRFKKSPARGTAYPAGLMGNMFGGIFSLPDESACTVKGKWLVVGSAADVTTFDQTKTAAPAGFRSGEAQYVVYSSDFLLVGTKGEAELNVY